MCVLKYVAGASLRIRFLIPLDQAPVLYLGVWAEFVNGPLLIFCSICALCLRFVDTNETALAKWCRNRVSFYTPKAHFE